jgi:surface polysaccharide O-acyltransferase-like enzyme
VWENRRSGRPNGRNTLSLDQLKEEIGLSTAPVGYPHILVGRGSVRNDGIRSSLLVGRGSVRNDGIRSSLFLNSMHLVRAIAIIMIVAGHSFWVAGLNIDTFAERFVANLICGATALFVFVSGFLFHHVFLEKFDYRRFLIGKAKTVLIPYLLLSFIPILLLIWKRDGSLDGLFLPRGEGLWCELVVPYLQYLWTGDFIQGGYWYIPFILITFLMSPLHVRFARLRPNLQWSIVLLLLFSSSLIQRPLQPLFLSPFQAVVYYLPLYLLGLTCSQHKKKILEFFQGRAIHLLIACLVFAAWQSGLYDWFGNYQKAPFSVTTIDLNLFQKVFLCLFFFVFLQRFEQSRSALLDLVANSSFAIFLLHPFILWLLYRFDLPHGWLVFAIIVAFIILNCIAVGYALRCLLGSKSRFLTGW